VAGEKGDCCIRPAGELLGLIMGLKTGSVDLCRAFRTRQNPSKAPIITIPPPTPPTIAPIDFFLWVVVVDGAILRVGLERGVEEGTLDWILVEDVVIPISRARVTLKESLVYNAFFSFNVNFKGETSTTTSM
jgi:hypothetical protein